MANLIETARAVGGLNAFVWAVHSAGLTDTLTSPGPYTVFAPSDAAATALPAGTLEELLKPENSETLAQGLLYHVVPGKLTTGDLLDGAKLKTMQGEPVEIAVTDVTKVNGNTIVQPDLVASNGILHVIDGVLSFY